MFRFFVSIAIVSLFIVLSCKNNSTNKTSEGNLESKEIIDTLKLKIDSLSKEIRKTPRNDQLFYNRALAYLSNGELAKAVNDLEIAKKLNPNKELYYLELSESELIRGESGIAKALLEEAHERFPESVEVMIRLSNIYMAYEQYQKARTYIILASRIEPRNPRLYLLSSMIFQEIDMEDKAIDELYLAIKYDPNYYDAHIMLGLLAANKSEDIAIDHYLNAINIEPENTEAYYNLAMYYQETSRYKKAMKIYRKVLVNIDSTLQHFNFNSGFVYENYLNRPDSAIVYYQRVLKYYPEDYRVYYRMGKTFEILGKISEAMASYDMCLKVNPRFEDAFDALSRLSNKYNKKKSNTDN
jgi:tetratricopeptide (TPR) repeat protein